MWCSFSLLTQLTVAGDDLLQRCETVQKILLWDPKFNVVMDIGSGTRGKQHEREKSWLPGQCSIFNPKAWTLKRDCDTDIHCIHSLYINIILYYLKSIHLNKWHCLWTNTFLWDIFIFLSRDPDSPGGEHVPGLSHHVIQRSEQSPTVTDQGCRFLIFVKRHRWFPQV